MLLLTRFPKKAISDHGCFPLPKVLDTGFSHPAIKMFSATLLVRLSSVSSALGRLVLLFIIT